MNENAWIFAIGTFVAVVSYFSKNFIFEPLLEFKKVKGKIQNKLKFYANKIHTEDKELRGEITKEFRQLSCDIEETYYAISLRKTLSWIHFIPNLEAVSEAASNLIGLSNSAGTKEYKNSSENIARIKSNLKII